MKMWQLDLERQLGAPESPGVLTVASLARAASQSRPSAIPARTLQYWIRQACARGRLRRINKGLYLNGFRSPPGRAAEAAAHLRRDAVVSLQSALAEAGVLNNPPTMVIAVVPIVTDGPLPSLGVLRTEIGDFLFRGLPLRILDAGDAADRLDLLGHPHFPCASGEKALLDWLYLAASPRSNLASPARHDIDVESLDQRKLRRLAIAMHLQQGLDAWLSAIPSPSPRSRTTKNGHLKPTSRNLRKSSA